MIKIGLKVPISFVVHNMVDARKAMEDIGLPPSVRELLYKPRGLVLVTGPTGSGKSTTLASMINVINEEREEAHIVTIEDPIEFYHKHKKAIVTQREIGVAKSSAKPLR